MEIAASAGAASASDVTAVDVDDGSCEADAADEDLCGADVADGNGADWPPLAVGMWSQLLRCQSQVLHRITRRSSARRTIAPIFELARESLNCIAVGAELKSDRSQLVHHLSQDNVPAEVMRHGKFRVVNEGCSVGALSIAASHMLIVTDLDDNPGVIGPELQDLLLAQGITATWSVPIVDEAGSALGALTLYFDKSTHASAENLQLLEWLADLTYHVVVYSHTREAKRVSDERFAVLVDSIPGVVYQRIVTPDGQIRYTYISNAAEDLFGVPPHEILADPNALFDCHGEGYREDFRERLIKASRDLKIWDVEATIVKRNGERKYTHAIAKPLEQADGTVVWNGVILDATRIKEAEMRAAAAEVQTREAIVENLNHGLVLFDANGHLVIANSRLKSYYPELTDIAVPGTTLNAFLDEERERDLVGDGEEIVHEDDDETSGRSQERQLRNGNWLLVQQHQAAGGETVILYTEITKLKEREMDLAKSNRELQDFASIASHDLQEPLRKIEAFGDRLRTRCADQLGEQGQFYLDRMQNASGRMRTLINDLLTYSRVTTKARPFEECSLQKIISEVLGDLQLPLEETGAEVEIGEIPIIEADGLQMRQLFQNLISNSLKYRKSDVPPHVVISANLPTDTRRAVCEIRVTDNGVGFEMTYAERIFAIFQRLHNHQEISGTGIGLATCRKIVERHRGTIRAESVPDEGSTFIVRLPMSHTES